MSNKKRAQDAPGVGYGRPPLHTGSAKASQVIRPENGGMTKRSG
jgi:hypothetical protein